MTPTAIVVCVLFLYVAIRLWKINRVVHHSIHVVRVGGLSKAHAHFAARVPALGSAAAAAASFAHEMGVLETLMQLK